MADKGMRSAADPTKLGWETNDFPILCETCLGDNPYVRMTREGFGGACHVCERPTSKFKWKAGAGRIKTTVVCAACARMKNVCQCCVLDLTYGVPVEVRDKVVATSIAKQMGISGGAGGGAVALPSSITAPLLGASAAVGAGAAVSEVNRSYAIMAAESAEAKAAATGGAVVPYSGLAAIAPDAHETLLRLGRSQPRYDRNAARLCTFYARGECNRGSECPYRHEMPRHTKDDPLAKQGYKQR